VSAAGETNTEGESVGNALYIPVLADDVDNMTAGLDYADGGMYLVPVARGSKNPGSIVGRNWQSKSSRDPEQIAAWYAGTDHGIALHLGRSGLLCFDGDDPEKVPPVLAKALAIAQPPVQRSRRDGDPRRGHFVFRMPAGRSIGNSGGKLGDAWGDVRGRNGVIIAAPSEHAKAADGGFYS
jgi:Bifunctional DNA primase/polymerase, N-terminal